MGYFDNALMNVILFLESFFIGGSEILNWFITPFNTPVGEITPLAFLSYTALIGFIPIAIVKWVLR